uniref:Aminotransferase-like plant mobile domain-containing protein n=1 Tax=Davidia involucrata TaxID=16924 RepID=A0A5B7ALD1_DAVIN
MSTSIIVVGGCEGDKPVQQPLSDAPSIPPPVSSYAKGRARGVRGGRRVRKPRRVACSSKVIPLGGEPCLEEAEGENSGSRRRKASKKVLEDDLTPEERAIPDTPLLHNLGKHPSVYARAGRGALTQNLNFRGAWPTAVGLYRQAHDQYKALFAAAGFGDFLKIDAVHIPLTYLVALMERWFSETNTLHLPCCEIGPTPLDWTMITGLRFQGKCITMNPEYEMSRALELLGVGPEAVTEGKIRLSNITPTMEEVKVAPATDGAKAILFRRLFLYFLGSCFFSNNRSVINHELVQFLEQIEEVGSYDWGAITYAAFLAGMRRKFWAFEYLNIFRPNIAIGDVFPRAIRWSRPRTFSSADFSDFVATRCQLDYIDEAQVTWQPYLGSTEFGSTAMLSTKLLAGKRVPFSSVDTWEYYLGERCRRQLGLSCRVPLPPPEKMHGTNAVAPEDAIGVGRSADDLVMDERVEYASWFAAHSIGRIVDVSRFLGGLTVGSKVLAHWMSTHHPNMMLIPQSEYEAMAEARDAAIAECMKLREELARAKGHSKGETLTSTKAQVRLMSDEE